MTHRLRTDTVVVVMLRAVRRPQKEGRRLIITARGEVSTERPRRDVGFARDQFYGGVFIIHTQAQLHRGVDQVGAVRWALRSRNP